MVYEDFKGDLSRNIAEQLKNPTAAQQNALLQGGNQNKTSQAAFLWRE
jgi:hypothetical protein